MHWGGPGDRSLWPGERPGAGLEAQEERMLRKQPGLLASVTCPPPTEAEQQLGGLGVGAVQGHRGQGACGVLVGGLCPWGAANKGNHGNCILSVGERPGWMRRRRHNAVS